jgi:hypothetical protein
MDLTKESLPESVFDVDRLTLECFMNKNVYRKVISKLNPALFRENSRFEQQKEKYKTRILERTEELLSASYCENNEIRVPIQESFDEYVKQVIQESEMMRYEHQEMDRDVLFEECDSPLENKSFWSKDKVVKK